jgi:signal transduction histidine kinase
VIVILSFAATHWGSPDLSLVVAVATVAIAAALGDSTRSRREYVVLLARRAFHAEQTREAEARRRVADERLRIARDLHDTVAHEISVISLNAGVASSALESSPERAQKALATIRSASRGALKEIGELLHYLRSDGEATTAPPRPILESLPELVTQMREGGLNVGLDIRGDVATVGPSASVVVYRIVQEGLTNAQKHGSGNSATVQVSITPAMPRDSAPSHVPFGIPGGTVRIFVTNPVDGVRRDVPGHGLGLVGIRERVAALGGHVTAERVGNQWVVDAVVPTVDVR